MYKFISVLILLISFNELWAQLSGPISGTLRADLSPYHVDGNVEVVDLVIEPGVTILFDGNFEFKIDGGVLKAVGFYSDSIIFKPDVNNSEGWKGLSFKNCSVPSELKYCRIDSSSGYGIKIDDCEPPTISNCKIVNNQGNGLEIKKVQNQISNCIIENNITNGVFLDEANTTIFNSIITKNINTGILSSNNNDSLSILNTVVADNQGTGILAGNGYVFVKNSIIYYNGIEIFTTGDTDVTYSNVRGSSSYPGIGNKNSPPQFLYDNFVKYTLSPSSLPCIDFGDSSSIYNDIYFPPSLGGERNDMGAYGGPLAGEWYPPLFIQPDNLNFGKVSYDSTVTITLNVKNYRDSTIIADSIYFVGNDTSVFISDTDYLNISVLDSAYINISFTPDRQGSFSVMLILETINYGKVYVPVSGQGVVSEFNYVWPELNFGTEVALGDSSTLDFPIFNSGDDTLKIYQIHTTKTQFTSSHIFMNINPDNPRDTLFVTFIPTSIDSLIDSLIMFTNDPDEGRVAFALKGQGVGPIINVNDQTIDFGSVYLTRDSIQTLVINNNGNDLLYINDIQVLKNDTISTSFRLSNDSIHFPFLIKQDSSYNLDVIFEPTILGNDSASIVIQSTDFFTPELNVELLGYSIAAVIQLNQTVVDFGLIPFNTFALDTITISNDGNYDLTINQDSLLFTGNHSHLFSVDSIISDNIPTGDSAYLYIKFFAGEEGIKQDSLQIVSNDLVNPKTFITVSGESRLPQIAISDTLFNFGDVLIDSAAFLSTTIYNNGLGELLILEDSLFVSGDDSNHFEIDSISKFSIDPSDSAFLRIKFCAIKVGQNDAYLNLISNDPNQSSTSFNLSGVVLSPAIDLLRTEINFGLIPLFTKKVDTLKIYNTGQELLTIYYDSLKIAGLDSQFFSIDSIISDSTLQPYDSAQIIISFNASNEGFRNADLIIYSDDQLLPEILVDLSGNCMASEITLSNTSIDFGIIPATTDTSLRLNIRNNGQGDLILYKEGFFLKDTSSHSFSVEPLDSNITVNPQDSVEINIGLITTSVGPKSDTLQIQCNDIDLNDRIKHVGLTGLIIDNMPASVSLDTGHSSGELTYHQNGNLRFEISTNFPTDSVVLFYRQGGAEGFNTANCINLIQMNLWEITIDSSWFASRGFEYFVRVFHGWRETDWPVKPKSLQVNFDKVEYPLMTQKELYQKISIPFTTANQTLDDLFGDELGSHDNTQYRIFDCVNGSTYTEIIDMKDDVPPGKSLWLITKNEKSLEFENAKTVPTDTTFTISLQPGWNMVANPFAFPINWDDNDPDHPLRFYNGPNDWPVVSVMEPFKGYAVNVTSASEIFLEPKEYTGSTNLSKQSLFSEYDWTINLKVEQNNIKDHFNIAGSKNNAFDGIDKYDYKEPPPIGNYIALYFLQNNKIAGKTEKYSTDIKSGSSDGYIYDFEVIGNVPGKKKLLIEQNSLPEEFQFVLVNKQSKVKYPSDKIELYSNKNSLQLIVGNEEFVNSHTIDYNFVPTNFRLEQNYPNPFNPSTNIKYELPELSKLSITVYNVLGQRIRTLLKNVEKEAGYYHVNWDGRNDSGNFVATGLYILNFHSNHYTKSLKMILQR